MHTVILTVDIPFTLTDVDIYKKLLYNQILLPILYFTNIASNPLTRDNQPCLMVKLSNHQSFIYACN